MTTTHGGRREGAGRPKLSDKDRKRAVSIRLTEAQWARLDRIRGGDSRSVYIGVLLEMAD